jgi:outer membrane receptor protein involved in Fe transport
LKRPLVGQSKNLFNITGEATVRGFSTRLLFNLFGDRIAEAGANEAPDVIEQGRGTLDVVFSQRVRSLILRLALENLTDTQYRFTQGSEDERLFKLGRTVAFSLTYSLF